MAFRYVWRNNDNRIAFSVLVVLNQHEPRKSDEKGRGVARGYYGGRDIHGVTPRVVFSC
jgi:hypothetical protein